MFYLEIIFEMFYKSLLIRQMKENKELMCVCDNNPVKSNK